MLSTSRKVKKVELFKRTIWNKGVKGLANNILLNKEYFE